MAKNTSKLLISLLVVVILGIAVVGYMAYTNTQFDNTPGATGPAGCNTDPSISFSTVDKLSKSTSLSPAVSAIVNGVYVGNGSSYSYSAGDKVDFLFSLTSYIDNTLKGVVIECGPNAVANEMYSTDSYTYRIKNDDGDFMTAAAAGGATNQTLLTAGETVIFDVEISGTDKESTGKMIMVVELGSSANISSITLSDATKASVPSFYTTTTAGVQTAAFEIPAIVGANKKTYSLSVALVSGKLLSGAVYTDLYTVQDLVDTDGAFISDIEDADGTIKYEDKVESDFLINAA